MLYALPSPSAAARIHERNDLPYDPSRGASHGDPASAGPSDPDALEELGDRIATLAAHIYAATQRLLAMIAEFDQRRGWEAGGYPSCAHWLAARTRMDLVTAREKVRVARELAKLPRMSASMARGELSFCAVRTLTRVATEENEEELVELSRGCTIPQIERIARSWKRGNREEAELERQAFQGRTFSIYPAEDGRSYVVTGRLTPEVAAVLMRAVEAASDALFHERRTPELEQEKDSVKAAAQRRADAIGLLAERALAAGFGRTDEGAGSDEADGVPISGSRAERYQVMLHVDAETLRRDGADRGSEFEDGTRASREASRRLACDAGLVKVAHKADGSVLDVGRKTRTIPPALRRALDARDRGCRFPDCGRRFCDAHHVKHWADGGETSLDNCLLLCRHHHRLVHECGWTIGFDRERRPIFFDPRGGMHYEGRWTPPELPTEVMDALLEENRAAGVNPDAWTASAAWNSRG